MKRSFYLLLLLSAVLLLAAQCAPDGDDNGGGEDPAPPARVVVPKFNSDSAYAFVAKQVAFGPRNPNSEGHRQCGDWIASKLKGYGAQVVEQPFQAEAYTGLKMDGRNIIGSFYPERSIRVVLAAHWDTRFIAEEDDNEAIQDDPILGADDGGSGVGVLLEIARQLSENDMPNWGVDLVFFDLEDQGERENENNVDSWCLGSQHWSRNPHVYGYSPVYGILLDMVGSKGARFTKERISMIYAPSVMDMVWREAQSLGYGNYFVNTMTGGITDDHYYVNTIAQIPMIDIINKQGNAASGFSDHWHTHDDDMDIIDPATLRAVGRTVMTVLFRDAAGEI